MRAATPGWSLVIGIATSGTPRASDSSVVFSPACVIVTAARSSSSSCGADRTTSGRPGSGPSVAGSAEPPSESTSCTSRPAQAAAIARKTRGRRFWSVPSEA